MARGRRRANRKGRRRRLAWVTGAALAAGVAAGVWLWRSSGGEVASPAHKPAVAKGERIGREERAVLERLLGATDTPSSPSGQSR